ncbi:MAG: LamG domain-containing protein [Planctomycetes bacterium]|nr:LamG domain-containing protein [Planctomycetota bacterium]
MTISIASILLSLSVGGYLMMNKTLAYNAAGTLVQGKILGARNLAIHDHASAYVTLDAQKNRIQTFGRTAAGFWHFDDGDLGATVNVTAGSSRQVGYLKNGQGGACFSVLVTGRYGVAISFPGPSVSDDQKRYVECGSGPVYVPAYQAREGVTLEAWVFPEDDPGGSPLPNGALLPVVCKIGANVADQDFAPYAIFLEYSEAEKRFKAGALVTLQTREVREVATPTALVRPDTWSHLSMTYTNGGGGLRLFVNGILRAETGTGVTGPLLLNNQPVQIAHTEYMRRAGAGPTSGFFAGVIDEVILGLYQTSAPETIPEKVTVVVVNPASMDAELGPYRFYFDARGYLDRQFHSTLPEILLLSPLISWEPEPHRLYESAAELGGFRARYLQMESQRQSLAEGNRVHRLKFTWAGTVE